MSLPAADDLFRRTAYGDDTAIRAVPHERYDERYDERYGATAPGRHAEPPAPPPAAPAPASTSKERAEPRRPSGRVRHDEKMTVYVTSAELLELEQARLQLRAHHGLAVDRGRLVREAIALVLADFEAHGDDSALVGRLSEG